MPKGNAERTDGYISIERAGKVWTALLEAKIGTANLDKTQISVVVRKISEMNFEWSDLVRGVLSITPLIKNP